MECKDRVWSGESTTTFIYCESSCNHRFANNFLDTSYLLMRTCFPASDVAFSGA